jgi:hypothetical protein
MNIYRHQFVCICPVNAKPITYRLEISSMKIIYVEKISAACLMYQQEFHEKIADGLARHFPGTCQVLIAHHHGVDIETRRGDSLLRKLLCWAGWHCVERVSYDKDREVETSRCIYCSHAREQDYSNWHNIGG